LHSGIPYCQEKLLSVVAELASAATLDPKFVDPCLTRAHLAALPEMLDEYWKYFMKTWVKTKGIGPETWNISNVNEEDLINRTNNPAERSNRTLNERMDTRVCICNM